MLTYSRPDDNLVERLIDEGHAADAPLLLQAAAHITALRAKVAELERVLQRAESWIAPVIRKWLAPDAEMSAQENSDLNDALRVIVAIRAALANPAGKVDSA